MEDAQGWVLADVYSREAFPREGIEIVAAERLGIEPDYRALLLRVLRKSPDMVVLFMNPPHDEIVDTPQSTQRAQRK